MVIEKAHAKVNLFLNVINKREDGFHNLEMIMAPLELHDELSFKLKDENVVTIETSVPVTSSIKDNLVYKVACFMKEKFSIQKGIHIIISKNIPLSAGLAGGSADAAATIRGVNRLFDLKLTKEEMAEIGIQFGSDIPFCIYNKMAIASSRGEQLDFIEHSNDLYVLVVNPMVPVSTKLVFDSLVKDSFTNTSYKVLLDALTNSNKETIFNSLFNSMEKTTFKLFSQVKDLKDDIVSMGVKGVLMSGSGGTVFALSDNKNELKKVGSSLNKAYYKELTKLM